jgi:hypothetical protein
LAAQIKADFPIKASLRRVSPEVWLRGRVPGSSFTTVISKTTCRTIASRWEINVKCVRCFGSLLQLSSICSSLLFATLQSHNLTVYGFARSHPRVSFFRGGSRYFLHKSLPVCRGHDAPPAPSTNQ